MWVNISMNSHTLITIWVIIWLWIAWVFWYNLYNKTRPDFKNVTYSEVSKTNILDIYIPKTAKAPYPVVIWVHGGGFISGNKSNPQSLDRLLSEWFAIVSVNYRLSNEAKWPAQLTDMENIIKFIKSNADTYKLKKDKIAVWGASAGGYLASMSLLALWLKEETKIQAGVDWFGPVDFYTMDEDMKKTGLERATGNNGDADSAESKLLGVTVKENKEPADKASILWYVKQYTSSPNPILIMHGKEDPYVAYYQSEKLRNALQLKFWGDNVEYHILPNGTHGWWDFQKQETEDTVINFLKKRLN
jgi:acetyl esterase/lipase